MTAVHAVLLIPAAGHEKLLAKGPFGARLPMAWECDWCLKSISGTEACGLHWNSSADVQCNCCLRDSSFATRRALVLKSEGEILWSGIDHLRRHPPDGPSWANTAILICSGAKTRPVILPGILVVLDADGREVRD